VTTVVGGGEGDERVVVVRRGCVMARTGDGEGEEDGASMLLGWVGGGGVNGA
jgi:hypothetical protein